MVDQPNPQITQENGFSDRISDESSDTDESEHVSEDSESSNATNVTTQVKSQTSTKNHNGKSIAMRSHGKPIG